MKRTDINRDKDGNYKPRKPLNKVGRRGKQNKKDDAATKKALIAERGEVCAFAGLSECQGPLEVHHLRTKAARPELRHCLDNLILCCIRHHSEEHIGKWKQ